MNIKRLLSLIALLLAATLLFASCDVFSTPDSEGPGDKGENPGDNPAQKGPYADLVEAWAEYVSYSKPEADKEYTSEKILSGLKNQGSVKGDMLVITENEEVTVSPEDAGVQDLENTEPVTIKRISTTEWYDVNTGLKVRSFVSEYPVSTDGIVHKSIDIESLVSYEISYLSTQGIHKVIKSTYSLKDLDELEAGGLVPMVDLSDLNNYQVNKTYSYYYSSGKEFLKDLESDINFRSVENSSAHEAGRYLIDSAEMEKTYLMEGGELVTAFGYKMEYNLPVYDTDSINLGGERYAYFEKNDNKYIITEEAPILVPIGELSLVMVPGITINVTDAKDKALASYTSDAYVASYVVLSNGNIYVCEYEDLNADAEGYDIKSGEEKLKINHKIINVADGSVSDIELSFISSKLFNNTTKEIMSFLNFVTMEISTEDDIGTAPLYNLDVKDGYILANVQKYADGELDPNSVFAVLNENLEIVAELPNIIPNQFSYPSFISDETMIVFTRTAYNNAICYSIDVKMGNVQLIPSIADLQNIDPIKDGYVWWKDGACKVYDKNWTLLKDYTEAEDDVSYQNFRIINGQLYYENSYSSGSISVFKDVIYKNYYSSDSEYSISSETVVSNASFSYYDGIIVGDNGTYYNINGNRVIDSGSIVDDRIFIYEEYQVGYYYGTATVESIVSTDAGYLVRVRNDWERSDYYECDLELYPVEFCEYEYFVIK